jgi:DNA replication protein DnaC
MIDRERRMIERRIKAAKFPVTKSLDSFDFKAIPKLNKMQVLELARCEWIERRENVIALGPSGTGKTHAALGLGLAACQKGLSVAFTTAAALVNEMMEARDERRLLRLQKHLAGQKLLIIDELGFVPLSKTGAELLFELISQRYERGATLITSNLPFDEWTEVFGSERLTGALLDRLTHHVNILEMNGDSYRLGQSRARKGRGKSVAVPSTSIAKTRSSASSRICPLTIMNAPGLLSRTPITSLARELAEWRPLQDTPMSFGLDWAISEISSSCDRPNRSWISQPSFRKRSAAMLTPRV